MIHRGASEARRWAFPFLAFVFRRTQILLMLSTTTIVHSEGRCLLLRLDLLHRPCETRPHPHLLPGCLPPSRTQDPPRDLDSVGRVSVGARETGAKEQGRAIETAHAEIRRSLSPCRTIICQKVPSRSTSDGGNQKPFRCIWLWFFSRLFVCLFGQTPTHRERASRGRVGSNLDMIRVPGNQRKKREQNWRILMRLFLRLLSARVFVNFLGKRRVWLRVFL